jgi:hypothetical protein
MTGGHSLQGLMRWLNRDEWRDRFAEVYDDHLLPTCGRTDPDVEEIILDTWQRLVHAYGLGLRVRGFSDP